MVTSNQPEESNVRDTYRRLDEDFNIHYVEGGEPSFLIGKHYSNLLSSIEEFVEAIAATESDAFEEIAERKDAGSVRELALGKTFRLFHQYFANYDDSYQFSENVTLFFDACKKFQLGRESLGHLHLPSEVDGDKLLWERCNEFIAHIRAECSTRAFKKRLYDRQYKAERNFESSRDYVDRLFAVHARLLIVRVDLGYQNAFFNETDLLKARADLDKLLNNRRSNKLFAEMVGYIWKLEYGVHKGYHYHCIFFFNGAKVQKDAYYASLIGNYWVMQITQGAGTMFNCNMQKNKYRYCGIGMINYDEQDKRDHLLRAISYLTKKEQFLRKKLSRRNRVFGRGEMLRVRRNAVGRPRK